MVQKIKDERKFCKQKHLKLKFSNFYTFYTIDFEVKILTNLRLILNRGVYAIGTIRICTTLKVLNLSKERSDAYITLKFFVLTFKIDQFISTLYKRD